MSTVPFPPISVESDDAKLVARSLQGDRDAFAAIVRRYQALVCALTYAACGDRHRSEDLAQETFLAAWKCLGELKDPNRLRAWLRGIARNVTCNAQRKASRAPTMLTPPEGDVLPSGKPTPSDEAITREEQALLWENLAKLPEDYREPLVLYYRQGESAAAVAAALEISEEAARQRLSRGRAMLARRIEGLIDRGLRQTAPNQGFALGVVAALPGMTAAKATATLGTSAKILGGGSVGSVVSTFLGPVIGFAGAYLGYRIGLEQTPFQEERRFIRRFTRGVCLFALCYAALLIAVIYGARWLHLPHSTSSGMILGVCGIYCVGIVAVTVWYTIRLPQLRARLLAEHPEWRQHAEQTARAWAVQYRSKWSLFGWPLIHVNIGQSADGRPAIARGWIAIGAQARGRFIAIGAIAIAPISWGGCSVGILTYGGSAVGIWSVGAIAVGWKAVGVCAAGWHGAEGIAVIAYRYATGITAVAHHANDGRAYFVLGNEPFFSNWNWIANHGQYVWPLAILVVLPVWIRARKVRRAALVRSGTR